MNTKTASGLAAVAAALVVWAPVGASAADLGGNCCADLEERVAELEATTARKGTRKVTLQISGHVSESLVFWRDGRDSGMVALTDEFSRTRFRFRGSAKINADWSAGFLIEIGVRGTNRGDRVTATDLNEKPGLDVRHEVLYLDSKRLGRITLGHTGSATDGITEICVGCSWKQVGRQHNALGAFVPGVGNVAGATAWRNLAAARGGFHPGEGDRRDLVMYTSPSLAGFKLSAAAGSDEFYDVALRYAGEFGGFKLAAGIGYSHSTEQTLTVKAGSAQTGCLSVNGRVDCEALGLSGGVQHKGTGLYVNGGYGITEDNNRAADRNEDDHWWVTAGVNRKFFAIGATNIFALYGESRREIGLTPATATGVNFMSIGIVQTIDAAATEIYATYNRFEGAEAASNVNDLDMIVTGMRIRF